MAVIVSKRVQGLVSNERLEAWRALVRDGARLRVGYPRWLAPFVQRGVVAITLGRTVYLADRTLQKSDRELRQLLEHELTHVKQVAQLGLIRFLYRYVREYITLRRQGLRSFEAYEAISFEREARAAEEHAGA